MRKLFFDIVATVRYNDKLLELLLIDKKVCFDLARLYIEVGNNVEVIEYKFDWSYFGIGSRRITNVKPIIFKEFKHPTKVGYPLFMEFVNKFETFKVIFELDPLKLMMMDGDSFAINSGAVSLMLVY